MAIEELVVPNCLRETYIRSLRNQLKLIDIKIEMLRDERKRVVERINGLTVTELAEEG